MPSARFICVYSHRLKPAHEADNRVVFLFSLQPGRLPPKKTNTWTLNNLTAFEMWVVILMSGTELMVGAICPSSCSWREIWGHLLWNECLTQQQQKKTGICYSPVSMAWLSFFFHCSATSFARGSSGLGALNNAWIDSNTVRICRAGDHLSGGKMQGGENSKFIGQLEKTRGNSE